MPAQILSAARRAHHLLIAMAALLTACGGGTPSPAPEAVVAAQAVDAQPARRILQAAVAAETPSLTIRAHADLAGDVGAILSVRVDGVVTDTVEVRATQPTDYRLAVPALKPVSQVDVVYTNDGAVNGVDRNLYVHQLSTADTAVLPIASFVTYDIGNGDAAFDCQNVRAGLASVYANGALRLTWPAPNLTDRLTVRASATPAGGTGALMVVRVDGVVVGSPTVVATSPTDHVFATPPLAVDSRVDVAFANAGSVDGQARSLRVHYLMAGTTVLQPAAGSMYWDAGSGLAAYDGTAYQRTSQDLLTANGALRGRWPAANMTDSMTLRASARLLGNVGPIVQVLVDGVVIGTVELRSTTPADITLPALPIKPGQRIEVVHTNPAEGRELQLAYAISNKTVLSASGNTLNAPWPEPNLTDTLLVRARGTLAGGTGPLMQVLVDGILVGSAEVKSTTHADYRFAVPAMSPGRKLDIVYTNDAAERELFIAYAATPSDRLQMEYARVMQRGLGANAALSAALAGVNVPAIPSTTVPQVTSSSTTLDKLGLARQLRMVAQMIAANPALGMKRQVFMVQMGGFDTHANQMRDQPAQMAQVAQSISYFMAALQTLGLQNNVTLFTASDFGRTLLSNGDGSDHGWGSHHVVAGGAVKGRQIVGDFPVTALGTTTDIGSGRLLPSLGVTQLASSLTGWMGLSTAEQQIVLPNLGNFGPGPALFG